MSGNRPTMVRRGLAVVALSALIGIVSTTPASAGDGPAELEVTKVVEGTAPADAEFVIRVDCVRAQVPTSATALPGTPAADRGPAPPSDNPPFVVDLTYGAEGGTQSVAVGERAECTITEIDNGGADSNTGPVQVSIEDPISYPASITNTFDPEPTTTTEAPTTTAAPTTAAAAAAVAQAPTFTG